MSRTILHLDADAFFASVEQSTDARLRGQPVAVGGEKRGIIASASYEARRFGVYTPMPTVQARRLCPRLIILPGDFDKYELFSRLMFSYAYDFTPDVEIGSIDEGYFDLTGARKPAVSIAETIQRAIRQSLKLSVSEGLGSNKLISQIASKLRKPAAFQYVPTGYEARFVSPLPNKWLPGIGPKTSNQLNAAGLARIGQIAHTPVDMLTLLVGNQALQLRNFACGLDERPVVPARAPAKSYGTQETFAADSTDLDFLQATLRRMADKLMAKVREDGKSIRTVTVKVRYNDMDEEQASESLPEPTDLETDIYYLLSKLLQKAWKRRVSLRLVSVKLSNVYDACFWNRLNLDAPTQKHHAQQRLIHVVDDLRRQFGQRAVLRSHDFVLRKKRGREEEPVSQAPPSSNAATSADSSASNHSNNASGSQPSANGNGHAPRQRSNPQLNESPVPYKVAVVQRQRLGHYAARQPPDGKARQIISHSPGPELRFRIQPPVGRVPSPGVTAPGQKNAGPSQRRATYIPLNVHSYYSFLDSTLSPRAIVDWAVRHDLPAIALTDRNNLHGAIEFAQAAAKAGIKPIIGAELEWNGQRLCVYVQNEIGYHNLCRILTRQTANGANDGKEKLASRDAASLSSEGSGFSGCPPATSPPLEERARGEEANPSSVQPFRLSQTNSHRPGVRKKNLLSLFPSPPRGGGEGDITTLNTYSGAERCDLASHSTEGLLAVSPAAELARFFPDRFYLESNSLETGRRTIPSPLPRIAAFPIHYELPADRWKYDVVQSIRTLTLLRQPHPEKRLDGEFHFRNGPEMQRRFAAHPERLAHSLKLAERCSFEFSLGQPQFPGYTPADGSTPAVFLRRLVMEGLRRRYPSDHTRLKAQVEQELAIITDVGYEEYFLVMWDILQDCRRHGIEWITRGSAADSLACYCLEISGVCPVRFDLYFRRFLNKERMALNKLPDIDVDFPHDRKDDVIDLIFQKFGHAHTAVVGGFSTFQSRSAFAEVAKVLGVSDHQARRITERLPHFSRANELVEAVSDNQECSDLPLAEEPYRTALHMAHFLDGFPRYPKMHPCGLVLSRQPMNEITPCFISAKGYPTTHFDMDSVEAVGLVKMDILAQGGLAVMRDVKEDLKGSRPLGSKEIDLEALEPWVDPEVWELIASGQARAVHHIESPAMISLCKMCNVQDIDTLIAIVSVIRPGAANESKKMEFARRYQGLSPVRYPHPSLEACLRSTYGLVVYEEHILQICEAFAGLPPGRADVLRRALGKDKTDIIDQIAGEFAESARSCGRTEADIAEVWNLVVGFKGYAFCKAHSTAYGVEAYQSAWLKRYYPAEFMAGVLTNGKGFYDPLVYRLECHRLGIGLWPPSVNDPGPRFAVRNGKIRVPVLQVKGLTLRTKENILCERERGPFASLSDFFTRVEPLNEEMEAMIQVGAFDEFGQSRTTQYWEFKALAINRTSGARSPKPASTNQVGLALRAGRVCRNARNPASQVVVSKKPRQLWLFPVVNLDRLPSVPLDQPDRLQQLRWEEALLGYPVSGHPLELYPEIAWETYCPINRLGEYIGQQIVTCGLVIEQRLFHQVTGEPMKFLTIADWTGVVETELFARTYKSYGLNTVRYRVLEIAATVEPFENGRGFTLRVLRAGRPRTAVAQPQRRG